MTTNVSVNSAHPANADLLKYFRSYARRRTGKAAQFGLDEYEMDTHPELDEKLYEIGTSLPENCRGTAVGHPVLVHPSIGVIFATASGTSTIAFRLPNPAFAQALASGAAETINFDSGRLDSSSFGQDWVLIYNPWRFEEARLNEWCLAAYEYAGTLVAENLRQHSSEDSQERDKSWWEFWK